MRYINAALIGDLVMDDDLLQTLKDEAAYWKDTDPFKANLYQRAHDRIAMLVDALELADAALSGVNMNMNVVERKVFEALKKPTTT